MMSLSPVLTKHFNNELKLGIQQEQTLNTAQIFNSARHVSSNTQEKDDHNLEPAIFHLTPT